jgi:Flp pilus assembly protein TadD
VALNPNCALGHARLGQALVHAGRAAEAIGPIERSLRHNPYDPQIGAYFTLLALAYYHAGRHAEAAQQSERAVRHGDIRAVGLHGAALARLGRVDEGRRAFSPDIQQRAAQAKRRRRIPYARQEDLLDLLEGLRLAGFGAPLLDDLREALAPGDAG